MDIFITQLTFFIRHDIATVFPIIYIAVILGGNIAAFATFWVGFASHFESWRMMAIFGVIAAAEMTGDLIWFNLGRVSRNTRFGEWVKRHLPGHARAESALQNNGKKFLYLSKFAYGSASVVLFSLGWSGMSLRTFFKNSVVSVILALPVVFIIAYGLFSGLSPLLAIAKFRYFEIWFLFAVVTFFILQWLLSRAVKTIFNGDKENK